MSRCAMPRSWLSLAGVEVIGRRPGAGTGQAATALAGGTLVASGGVDVQAGSLGGVGTLTANVTNAGQVSPGSPIGRIDAVLSRFASVAMVQRRYVEAAALPCQKGGLAHRRCR